MKTQMGEGKEVGFRCGGHVSNGRFTNCHRVAPRRGCRHAMIHPELNNIVRLYATIVPITSVLFSLF